MNSLPDSLRSDLPAPYHLADFAVRRRGIADDSDVNVFVDAQGEFAVLHPRPALDYSSYVPRQKKLGLSAYKKSLDVIARRFAKIGDIFPRHGTVLEVGAAEGGFLEILKRHRPELRLVAVEPDQDTRPARAALGVADYRDIESAALAGVVADVICLFHVFEHIPDPAKFIAEILSVLTQNGRVVMEVPSLDDPLLSLYGSAAYEAFYFQRQHPFVYSARSLSRVLEACGLRVVEMRPYQRYGLENHLTWLAKEKPGGDVRFAECFGGLEPLYRAALEERGQTDTIFAVAERA